jgi:hypothetical protein
MNAIPWKSDVWRTGRCRWSPEQIAEICAMKGRKSASQIGALYGVTRGAICGVWFRARQIAEEGGE